jgi:signal transduction histidine kinase
MVKDILSFGIKTIVCGDANQLPPIGDEPGFLTGYNIHWLTQLMRQAKDSPIVYLANRASKGEFIHCGTYGNDVMVITDDELIPEMDKDVKRLERIAERFSKIGSLPEPKEGSMNEVLEHVIDYMDRRTSNKVEMIRDFPAEDVIVRMNSSLFEWVIENLCKNAVDAMEGKGRLLLTLKAESNRVIIEVTDNGKGIRKRDIKNVFTPGFTTKQRGWGLGLSLARRIVEDYHKGRIFVKSSEVGKGTTFRIEMPR